MRTIDAVRAFNRIWSPISDLLDEGASADAKFDGGEFSGPASARHAQDVYEETLERVASRFGLTSHQLDYAVQAYNYANFEHYMSSQGAN